MRIHKSTGGWLSFHHEQQPDVPVHEEEKIFTKKGLAVIVMILMAVILGGIVCSCLFGPRM